jgi:hypothetical protein
MTEMTGLVAWIIDRLYGHHTHTGTAYPMRGEGFVELDQRHFSALRMVARYKMGSMRIPSGSWPVAQP